jgi:hypothetical protein
MQRKSLTIATLAVLAGTLPAVAAPPPAEEGRCPEKLEVCVTRMVDSLRHRGWVGIELETEDEAGLRITRVVPDGPAAAAGLQEGDLLKALEGIPYDEDHKVELKGHWPEPLIEKMVGYHVMHYHVAPEARAEGGEKDETSASDSGGD